uniref:hypothetical protein n=1 Tax=Serratia proteamaculans TaxID=28151 RepID=UPI001F4C52A7|nr:hypothetical protein [Serratia proteamaculans]ULG16006.1 hypothetical protein 591p_00155 [Serratia proteamaculans]
MTFKVEVTITHAPDGLNTEISCIGSGCQHEFEQAQFLIHLLGKAIQQTGGNKISSSVVVNKGESHVH